MVSIRYVFAVLALVLLPGAAVPTSAGAPSQADHVDAPSGQEKTADAPNGFVLDHLQVPRTDVVAGGPPRDGIHSVDEPRFAAVEDARWVRGDTPVIGVVMEAAAHAYPIHVMEWHQIVNDRLGGVRVTVTYDPITDLAGAWRMPQGSEPATFGVSGLLDRDGFLLYDRETSSLWSSATGEAISGARAGERMTPVRVRVETMARWFERHPDTRVLELPERRRIDYRHSPFSTYGVSEAVPLAVRARDDRFHPKEVVLGVEHEGTARAYLGSILTQAGGRIVDELGSARLRIAYDGESGTFSFEAPDDVRVRSAYWFAWKSMHPDTEIWGEDLVGDGSAKPDGRRPAPPRDAD